MSNIIGKFVAIRLIHDNRTINGIQPDVYINTIHTEFSPSSIQ